MHELIEHIGRCYCKAAEAQPGDLAALVELHTELMATHEMTCDQGASQVEIPADLLGTIDKIAKCVEDLVLTQPDDDGASIRRVSTQISALQNLIKGTDPVDPAVFAQAGGANAADQTAAKTSAKATDDAPAATNAVAAIDEEGAIAEADAPLALEFVGEALGHLEAAEASLLKLEDDPNDMDDVNAVFRAFHTIKGVAGFLGLKQIGALAHAAETLLDLARKGKIQLAGNLLDVVLEARDAMGQMVASVETAAKSYSAPAVQAGLNDLLQRLSAAARCESPASPPSKPVSKPVVNEAIATQATPSDKPTSPPPPSQTVSQVPVAAATAAAAPTAIATPGAGTPTIAAAKAPDAAPASTGAPSGDGAVKVSTGRLDALIDAVGELVIAQAMVTQDLAAGATFGDQRLSRNLSHLGKISRGLQDLSMSMRMVPIAGVFQKMARLIRDLGRKAGKEVELIQIGGETELDRNVVEAVSDPLVHMVRNAVDHGLEYPDDRVKAGKPRCGRVVLKACHQAGNVVIEIADDGRGLNQPRILQKAIAAGIVKEGQELSEQQIFQLIFHPGLSTAEKVTDISGRGVGMDVVRRNVDALRGRIEIASTFGAGSTFTVRLPLTLAVIDGLIVRVGAERYIVPITSIEQSIRPAAAQLSSVHGKGEMCMVRDRLLPIVRLHRLFNVKPKTEDPTQALIVIVQDGLDRCCVLVDELVGQQQVVIKSLGEGVGRIVGISGCAILGDGNVSLILDVAGIINSALS